MNTLGPLKDRLFNDNMILRLYYSCKKDLIDVNLLRESVVMTPYDLASAIESHIISVLIEQRLKK